MRLKKVSAYFIFCSEQREVARAECLAETGEEKVSVASVARRLGSKWNQLTAEEKSQYERLAKEKYDSLREKQDNSQTDPVEQEEEGVYDLKKEEKTHQYGFPLNPIRRIMLMDDEVSRISSDAVKATAKAAELIIQELVAKAHAVATANKRSTVQFQDIQTVVSKDVRWVESGFARLLREDSAFEKARAGGAAVGGSRHKVVEEDPKARKITSFFQA